MKITSLLITYQCLPLLGHKMIVQEFIKRNMKVDIADASGHTPLHLACLRGHQSCVVSSSGMLLAESVRVISLHLGTHQMLLLYEEASINKPDKAGNTPLHLACSHGHEDVSKTQGRWY